MNPGASRLATFKDAVLRYLFRSLMIPLITVVKGATENEVIKNIQKAEYIYVVRSKDAKAFVLLDNLKLGHPNVTDIRPYLRLGSDALCLKGNFGNGNFFIVHPVLKNDIYFTDVTDNHKTPKKNILEVFKNSKVNINLAHLSAYTK